MTLKKSAKEPSQVEDTQLRDYEMVIIISPELEGENFDATLDKVSQFITERGGVVSEVDRWGKRRLAYPIAHFTEGNYVLSRFKLKPGVNKELEASLHISEDVLRHLLIKIE